MTVEYIRYQIPDDQAPAFEDASQRGLVAQGAG